MTKSKETVTLTGSPADPEMKASETKIKRGGREVKFEPRPSHDSGLCPCGKYQGSCQAPCGFDPSLNDHGAVMGISY